MIGDHVNVLVFPSIPADHNTSYFDSFREEGEIESDYDTDVWYRNIDSVSH